ncbi:hypothetical protein BDF20DRAFT_801399, partial [Mycotypha africana]|uniref:uncharacterized protein n=1 Tax=Mycotypha africana TaxID=64632 RepID=UPI002300473F
AKELSKLILRTALQKANIAVQCDSTNNVLGAITAYKEAVNLLERVLITADNEGDRQRLQNIHDSYSERIVLLSALTTARLPQQQQRSSPVATSQNNNTVYSTNNESSPLRSGSISMPAKEQQQTSNKSCDRSSSCSIDSSISIDNTQQQLQKAQTSTMILPSFVQSNSSSSTTKKVVSTLFRSTTRNSSLHLKKNSSCSSTTSTTNTSATVLSRPSLNSGLGSMRRKAANRLSMDGLMGKNNTASSTINNHPTMAATTAMTPIAKNASYSQQYLKLLLAIERSMSEGAYLTQKLYIPKNLWQQPNIRLSSMDIKISACESIMNDMARLENWIYLDDLTSSIRIIQQLETTVDQLQTTLAKKLKRESTPTSDNSSQQQQFNYTQ